MLRNLVQKMDKRTSEQMNKMNKWAARVGTAYSTDHLSFGPTIFLGQPTQCKCDAALPARGQGNGECLHLHNERLNAPIIFMCPGGAAVRRRHWHYQLAKQRSPYLPTYVTNPNGHTTRYGDSLFLFRIVPAANWYLLPNKKQGVTIRRRRSYHLPAQSSYPTMALSTIIEERNLRMTKEHPQAIRTTTSSNTWILQGI